MFNLLHKVLWDLFYTRLSFLYSLYLWYHTCLFYGHWIQKRIFIYSYFHSFFVHVLAPISFLFFIFCTECFKTELCCYFCRDFLIFLCKISYSFYQTGFYRILEVIIKLDIIIIFPLIGYLKRRNLK